MVSHEVLGIHLRHDERHLGLQAEGGAVVNRNASVRGNHGTELQGRLGRRRNKNNIGASQRFGVRCLNDDFTVPEAQLLAGGTWGGQEPQRVDRELGGREHLEKLSADGASSANDCDLKTHIPQSFKPRSWSKPYTRPLCPTTCLTARRIPGR